MNRREIPFSLCTCVAVFCAFTSAQEIRIGESGFVSDAARPNLIVTIGETKTCFLVDTGSSRSVIDRGLAEVMGMKFSSPLGDGVWSAPQNVVLSNGGTRKMQFAVADLGPHREVAREDFFGILGTDALEGMVLVLNYDKRFVGLTDTRPSMQKDLQGTLERDSTGCPTILASIGKLPVRMLLDSAGDFSVRLDSSTFSEFCKMHQARSHLRPISSLDASGVQRGESYAHGEVELSNKRWSNIVVSKGERAWQSNAVGTTFLRRFNACIDLKANEWFFSPSAANPCPDSSDCDGMVLDPYASRCSVLHVLSNSGADRAGILPGDSIVAAMLNKDPLRSGDDILQSIRLSQPGKLLLTVRRAGKELSITFRDN